VFKASTQSPGYQTTSLCVSSPSEARNVLLTLGFYPAHEKHIFMAVFVFSLYMLVKTRESLKGYFWILIANKWKIISKNEVFCFAY
jgi:hypothetical protein